jgi:hypothetical protein
MLFAKLLSFHLGSDNLSPDALLAQVVCQQLLELFFGFLAFVLQSLLLGVVIFEKFCCGGIKLALLSGPLEVKASGRFRCRHLWGSRF